MKKIYLMLPLLFLFTCCKNKDLVIQKSRKNCGCIEKLAESIGTTGFCQIMRINCENNPFSRYDYESLFINEGQVGFNNYRIFSKTNSIQLVNKSKTKVYKILVQIDNNGKVNYEEFVIEPTTITLLGCDSDFNVEYNENYQISSLSDCYEALRLSNLSKNKIEYNIHKVELISEY